MKLSDDRFNFFRVKYTNSACDYVVQRVSLPCRSEVLYAGVLEAEILGDALESLHVEGGGVGATAHIEVVAVSRQPEREERREEDVHVAANEEVEAGLGEVVVAVEAHEDGVGVAVVGQRVLEHRVEGRQGGLVAREYVHVVEQEGELVGIAQRRVVGGEWRQLATTYGLVGDERAHGLVVGRRAAIARGAVELVHPLDGDHVVEKDDEVGAPLGRLVALHLDPAAIQPLELERVLVASLHREVDDDRAHNPDLVRLVIGSLRVVVHVRHGRRLLLPIGVVVIALQEERVFFQVVVLRLGCRRCGDNDDRCLSADSWHN